MGLLEFYKGKSVFITGHTGFKGAWLCKILSNAGANITGYSLDPPTQPNLFSLIQSDKRMRTVTGDVRDLKSLLNCMIESQAEIAFHLAAQPIVRASFTEPRLTYETNVMGTVNFLEAIRACDTVKSVVNVTTDKVYENKEWIWGYRENDTLNGFDPYSNSKSCSELVTHCYKASFLGAKEISVSTTRAGNVIGGGDFAADRIIPDCVRAALGSKMIHVRNPDSIRPYQHVLEALGAYLLIAKKQYENRQFEGEYNVGPNEEDIITTGELAQLFCELWGTGVKVDYETSNGPHETGRLRLDCSKIKSLLGWRPKWNIETALEKTIEWSKAYSLNSNINGIMDEQIRAYFAED